MTQTLIDKFERDMSERSRVMRLLLVLDQMFNVLILNGSQDETISSHIARRQDSGEARAWEYFICDKILSRFERSHCKKSLGE